MASNKKLTAVIQGRSVTGVDDSGGTLRVHFGDGSAMTVRTGGPASGPTTGVVKAVRQAGTRFDIDYVSGGSLEIALAEETSSVMLRDRNGVMEYAD